MRLTSSAFTEGKPIPRRYSCQGENISPPLEIHSVPKHAKSLALIMDDPDVPPQVRTDRMWVHWLLYNIDPHLTTISENTPPPSTPGRNTDGTLTYMGPCPPDREHRYFFKLYALDTLLPLAAGATKEQLLQAMEGHILLQTELMGTYVKS